MPTLDEILTALEAAIAAIVRLDIDNANQCVAIFEHELLHVMMARHHAKRKLVPVVITDDMYNKLIKGDR